MTKRTHGYIDSKRSHQLSTFLCKTLRRSHDVTHQLSTFLSKTLRRSHDSSLHWTLQIHPATLPRSLNCLHLNMIHLAMSPYIVKKKKKERKERECVQQFNLKLQATNCSHQSCLEFSIGLVICLKTCIHWQAIVVQRALQCTTNRWSSSSSSSSAAATASPPPLSQPLPSPLLFSGLQTQKCPVTADRQKSLRANQD